MESVLGFLGFLLIELPARVLGLAPGSPWPLIAVVVIVLALLLVLRRNSGGRRRKRRR
jgi:hypothetical protein